MILRRDAQQAGAEYRSGLQIEGAADFLEREPSHLRFRIRMPADIEDGQFEPEGRVDHLHGLVIFGPEDGSERLVAIDDSVQSPLDAIHAHGSLKTQSPRRAVERTVRFELIEEPEPVLSERERQGLVARDTWNRREVALLASADRFDALRELGDGRRFKERSDRQFNAREFADARCDLRRKQRVSAQSEEVVSDTDLGNA